MSPAVSHVDAAVRVTEGPSREAGIQHLHKLKAAQLGGQLGVQASLGGGGGGGGGGKGGSLVVMTCVTKC